MGLGDGVRRSLTLSFEQLHPLLPEAGVALGRFLPMSHRPLLFASANLTWVAVTRNQAS